MSAKTHWSARAKRIAIGALLYLSAVAVGLGSAWWMLKKSPWLNPSVKVGAWSSNLQAGSQDAGMYTRATIAVNALLALGRDETMYFVATRDDVQLQHYRRAATGALVEHHCLCRRPVFV